MEAVKLWKARILRFDFSNGVLPLNLKQGKREHWNPFNRDDGLFTSCKLREGIEVN